MARSIVDELFDRLIRAFPPDRGYGRNDFSTPPMPGPMAHFLEQLLQRRLDLEMRNIRDARSAWIDYDHPEVQDAERAFQDAIASHLRIPAAEWQDLLRRAVQRITAYLIHPTQTMTHFVFGDQDEELPPRVIRKRIGFFSAYPYLRETIDAYLDRDGTASLGRGRFKALLTRIDERVVADYDADDWMRLLDPLFNLMDLAAQRGVPVSFLQTFFQSKGATAIVQRLHAASLEYGTTVLDRTDLRQLIASAAVPSGDAAPDADPTPPSPPPSPEEKEAPTMPDAVNSSSSEAAPEPPEDEAAPDGPTPLWKRFRHAGPAPENPTPTAEAITEDTDEPLWTRFRPVTESSAPAATPTEDDLADLERAVLGERVRQHRDLFIQKLFGGSRDEYGETLRRLHTAPSWTRASQIIAQDVFRAHQVNIYSKPAVTFTNAVEDQFRRRT